jgi:ABC-type uncharacterized transport system involved in gliding motility auxiliary subunit
MAKKKNAPARYAVIGLIIAGLGCIATGLLALVQGSIALKLFTPAKPETIPEGIAVSAAVIVLGLAIYGILNPDGVRRFFSGRQARYGSNTLVMTLAFVGILFVVNLLVYQNPKSWDFTEDKQHTLAPQTIQALAALPEKVTAIGFFTVQTPSDTAKQLLTDFKSNSKGKFDYRFVDPNSDPVLARQYGITGDGKIVLTMGKSAETANSASETDIDQALIRLISPQQRVVYFLTGHGEPDINGTDSTALSRARTTLVSKNYTVKTLNLAAENKIPDDAKAIIVAGPTNPLLDQEVALLKAYMDKGGSLIVMEDPTPFTKFGTSPDPLADYLKTDWGITLENDVVIDLTSQQPLNAISASYSSTAPITQHTTAVTIMPQTRSLTISKAPPANITDTALITTSQNSWGETDLASLQNNQQISFDQTKDIAGPLTIAVSGQNTVTNSHLVVFGNSIFATDKGFDAYANGDIFVNSVDWVAQQSNLINITPHTPITRTFNAPGQIPFIIILLGSVIVIPGLVVAAGISTWFARRRQG